MLLQLFFGLAMLLYYGCCYFAMNYFLSLLFCFVVVILRLSILFCCYFAIDYFVSLLLFCFLLFYFFVVILLLVFLDYNRCCYMLFYLSGLVQGQTGKPLGCQAGWVEGNGYCYLFNTYKKVTFRQAEQECNKYDSSALYIESQTEYVSWVSSPI